MKIIEKKIEDLIEADYNPRLLTDKQKKDLNESLTKFGIVDPIIINKNKERKNVIIGGHQRCRVWKEMGNKTVPCIELDLTLEKERELNIRLNKNTGEFDITLLKEHFDDEDLMGYGFEDYELGVFDKPDYSILDDEDLEDEMSEMEAGVKKAIQIEFEDDEFEEAKELHHYWREQGADVGMMLLEAMREAQQKESAEVKKEVAKKK